MLTTAANHLKARLFKGPDGPEVRYARDTRQCGLNRNFYFPYQTSAGRFGNGGQVLTNGVLDIFKRFLLCASLGPAARQAWARDTESLFRGVENNSIPHLHCLTHHNASVADREPGLILRYVPLQSRNRAGRIDRGGGAASSGEFAGHDGAVAATARAGGGFESHVSRVSACLRRAAENGPAGARRVG